MTNTRRSAPRTRGLFGQPLADLDALPMIRIVRLSMRLSRKHLAEYPHKFAPQKFTQHQLFACLVLKAHLGCTYRKLEEHLLLSPALREALGLCEVPRFTTLQAFADKPEIFALIDGVLRSIGRAIVKQQPQDAAIDGTGMEATTASAHFVSRAGRTRGKYVKLLLGVLCGAVIPVSLVMDWGPSHDLKQAWKLREKMQQTCGSSPPKALWGDGAFDCEAWHRANWETWNVPSYAPVTIRSKDGSVGGLYRNVFATNKPREYGRRWMCETVNSAIKRISGSTLRSRKESTLFAEAALKVAAYAIKR
jgi:Transposase DDE domain